MKTNKILLLIILLFASIKNSNATDIDGTSNIAHINWHYRFNQAGTSDNATGFVRLKEGFTVPADTSVTLDVTAPVSSGIDLEDTGKIILDADLFLDSSVTLSNSGIIHGKGNTIFLCGDLTIPANTDLKFTNSTIIDGMEHDLILGNNAQLLIESQLVDSQTTLTLKNLTLKNTVNTVNNPPIRCFDWYSNLALENVKIKTNDDFAFRNGHLFVHNDVVFSGSSKFIYNSAVPSYITPHSCLKFDPGTTFEYYPSSTNKDLFVMSDETSILFLNGCTLQTTNTGIRLAKGSLWFDNKVTLTSNVTLNLSTLESTTWQNHGTNVFSAEWSPNGKYLAVAGENSAQDLIIYEWDGSILTQVTTKNFGTRAYSAKWHPDGKYLAIGGLNSTEDVVIYKWDGSSLTKITSKDHGARARNLVWSPNGKYLAVVGDNSSNDIIVYEWDGSSLTQIATQAHGSYANAVDWSPDGNYLAIGGYLATYDLVLYEWNGSSLTQVAAEDYGSVNSLNWSPDGLYLAVGGSNSSQDLTIYLWNGSTLTQVTTKDHGTQVLSANWTSDGKYLAVGGQNDPNDLIIYKWDGSSLTQITSKDHGTGVFSVAWWSPDGKYLAVGGTNNPYNIIVYTATYSYNSSTQPFSNSIIFGDSSRGSDFDLDVSLFAGARVELDGFLYHDSISNLDFANKIASFVLSNTNSRIQLPNTKNITGRNHQSILLDNKNETCDIDDNSIFGFADNDRKPAEESFELIDDLVIPDNFNITFAHNGIIDGQGHSLILGRMSQLLVDGGVTLTLKNLTLKNSLNTIAHPPIRCMDWYSQLTLDNVKLAFSNDFHFTTGQLFIHNDVVVTGTSKFVYNSVRPSYIASHACLNFEPETTFEYYPSSTNKDLFVMSDETSILFLNGSTLRTTNTGMR